MLIVDILDTICENLKMDPVILDIDHQVTGIAKKCVEVSVKLHTKTLSRMKVSTKSWDDVTLSLERFLGFWLFAVWQTPCAHTRCLDWVKKNRV